MRFGLSRTLLGSRADGSLQPVVETLANAEGLDAHKNAVTIRLKAMAESA